MKNEVSRLRDAMQKLLIERAEVSAQNELLQTQLQLAKDDAEILKVKMADKEKSGLP